MREATVLRTDFGFGGETALRKLVIGKEMVEDLSGSSQLLPPPVHGADGDEGAAAVAGASAEAHELSPTLLANLRRPVRDQLFAQAAQAALASEEVLAAEDGVGAEDAVVAAAKSSSSM